MQKNPTVLEDIKIHVKYKLSMLWASLTLCFLYGDYFGLYKPGKIQKILDGVMGPLGNITQEVLLGTSILLSIPCVMVFLSATLKPVFSRWLSIIFGVMFAIMMILSSRGAWDFYIYFAVIEIAIILQIIWHSWFWPKQ